MCVTAGHKNLLVWVYARYFAQHLTRRWAAKPWQKVIAGDFALVPRRFPEWRHVPQANGSLVATPRPDERLPVAGPTSEASTDAVDFRQMAIHFGNNRGLTLADLSLQQLHWYEAERMPTEELQGPRDDGDRTLLAGLKAYRQWREAEGKSEAPASNRRSLRTAATRMADSRRFKLQITNAAAGPNPVASTLHEWYSSQIGSPAKLPGLLYAGVI